MGNEKLWWMLSLRKVRLMGLKSRSKIEHPLMTHRCVQGKYWVVADEQICVAKRCVIYRKKMFLEMWEKTLFTEFIKWIQQPEISHQYHTSTSLSCWRLGEHTRLFKCWRYTRHYSVPHPMTNDLHKLMSSSVVSTPLPVYESLKQRVINMDYGPQ